MGDTIRINNTDYSWESVELYIDGDQWEGITAIKWGQTRERTKSWGAKRNGKPRGRTAGKYTPKPVTITWNRESYLLFIEYLAIEGLGSYGDTEFDMSLQYIELGKVATMDFSDCCIVDEDDDNTEGTDALTTDCSVDTMDILRNGLSLYSVTRSF